MTNTAHLSENRCTRPQETCDWLDRGTFERLCASAYEMAVNDMHPPTGEPFVDGDVIWASRRDFANTLADVLGLHIFTQAHASGLPGYEVDVERFHHWHQHVPTATTRSFFCGPPGKTLPPAPNGSKSNQEADAGDHP